MASSHKKPFFYNNFTIGHKCGCLNVVFKLDGKIVELSFLDILSERRLKKKTMP